jgi:hypothetical protein
MIMPQLSPALSRTNFVPIILVNPPLLLVISCKK